MPPGEQADLKNKVLESARTGLAKLNQGEGAESFTFGCESVGLEAVILTDGERPSLFVTDGFVSLDAPDIGTWAADLGRVKTRSARSPPRSAASMSRSSRGTRERALSPPRGSWLPTAMCSR